LWFEEINEICALGIFLFKFVRWHSRGSASKWGDEWGGANRRYHSLSGENYKAEDGFAGVFDQSMLVRRWHDLSGRIWLAAIGLIAFVHNNPYYGDRRSSR
jgi:hypothetical protein